MATMRTFVQAGTVDRARVLSEYRLYRQMGLGPVDSMQIVKHSLAVAIARDTVMGWQPFATMVREFDAADVYLAAILDRNLGRVLVGRR